MQTNYTYAWADIAFGSKKPLRELHATFIAAPREMSVKRFTQLIKEYLPKGHIILGIANEPYVDGFSDQQQFKTLQLDTVQQVIDTVNASASPHKIYSLTYFQRELPYIIEKLRFSQVVLVNGSWYTSFHTTPAYYALVNSGTPFTYVSPFVDEVEARAYAERFVDMPLRMNRRATQTTAEMIQLAADAAKHSFATDYQTGAALGKEISPGNYQFLAYACNTVVPYRTYAMHHGSSREAHFSPPHDQNYYDTIHAETALMLTALKDQISPNDTTLFINLLPCPACARMLCQTDITGIIYELDHSDGYAVKLLETAGKKITRIVR